MTIIIESQKRIKTELLFHQILFLIVNPTTNPPFLVQRGYLRCRLQFEQEIPMIITNSHCQLFFHTQAARDWIEINRTTRMKFRVKHDRVMVINFELPIYDSKHFQ